MVNRNNYLKSTEWESGFNMFSLNTMKRILEPHAKWVRFHKFCLSKELPQQDNPINAFTVNRADGQKIIINGANIVAVFYLVEFQKK